VDPDWDYPGGGGAETGRCPVRLNLKTSLFVPIAVLSGLVVLLGYFIQWPPLADLRSIFLRWAVILTAVVLLIGVWNLARVHWHKIQLGHTGAFYSGILLASLAITFLVTLLFSPAAKESLWIFNYLQVPVEVSLMAVLAVALAYSAIRLVTRRMNPFTFIFLGTVLLVLIGMVTLPLLPLPFFGLVRTWIIQVPAVGGGRGILLGVALGTIATGLRILVGADRPYDGG